LGGSNVSAVSRAGILKGIEILPRFKLPARAWLWSAGIAICLLEASGVVAIVRSVPSTYAGGIADVAAPAPGQTSTRSGNLRDAEAQGQDARTQLSATTRPQAKCPECGTIASVREIEGLRDADWRESVDFDAVRRAIGIAATSAIDTTHPSGRIYEIAVRFRDGTTTVFNEPGPPTWRIGSRVIVIAGAKPSGD
jgi:hypothetical protein